MPRIRRRERAIPRRLDRLCLMMTAALLCASMALPPTAPASLWSTTASIPTPTVKTNLAGSSIYCTGKTTSCVYVGNLTTSTGTTLPQAYKSGLGSIGSPPVPTEAKTAAATGVACEQLNLAVCEMVGSFTNKSGIQLPLADNLSGKEWKVYEPPLPKEAKAGGFLNSACESLKVTSCTATGSYINSIGAEAPLAEQWDGRQWKLQEPPIPKEAKASSLSSVACFAIKVTGCNAVGSYTNGSGARLPLAERWDGKQWKLQEAQTPKGAKEVLLAGIGCESLESNGCEAVGRYTNGSSIEMPLAEQWTGGEWKLQEPSLPKEGKAGDFTSIGCEQTEKLRSCEAVGEYTNSIGIQAPFAERWDGKSWTVQELSGFPLVSLAGVSCGANGECQATGGEKAGGVKKIITLKYVAGTWKLDESSSGTSVTPNAQSASVSCPSTTAECLAVGNYKTTAGMPIVLADSWNGKAWTLHEPAKPKETEASSLAGAACASLKLITCEAVGYSTNDSNVEMPLAELWNGEGWSLQEAPQAKISKASSLKGVSCQNALSTCVAVGSYTSKSGGIEPFAESWNGKEWTQQTVAEAKEGSLSSVSCFGSEETLECEAVGSYINETGERAALAEQLKGNEWSIKEAAKLVFAESAGLSSVSCVSSTFCIAAGSYTALSELGKILLIELWNGTRWSSQEISDVKAGEHGVLSAVSCISSEICMATGVRNSALIAEQLYKEAWSPQKLASSGEEAHLEGLSCPAVEGCVTVGATKESGTERPLGEHYEETPEVVVNPSVVKFGNAMTGERVIEYTNNGPIVAWAVPTLAYTVETGSKEAVTIENGCNEQKVAVGAKCTVTLKYKVPISEAYKATLKLAPAANVTVEAEA